MEEEKEEEEEEVRKEDVEDHHHRQTRIPSNKCRQCTNKVKIKSFKNTKTFPSFQTKWFISFFFYYRNILFDKKSQFCIVGLGLGEGHTKGHHYL